ncbi:FtsX-like permease family protein [Schumannella luteola]|nr:FtsX-like permease family protein [Schumannella luteola]
MFFASGAFVALCLYIVVSAASPEGQEALRAGPPGSQSVVAQIAIFLMALGIGVPTCFVIATVATTALTQERPRLAAWRLAGASPSQVKLIVLGRLICTAIVFAVVGAVLSAPLAQVAIDFLLSVTTVGVPLPAHVDAGAGAVAVAIVALLAVVGGIRPAVLAGRVPPVEAVRERREASRRLGVGQWILAGIVVAAAVFLASGVVAQRTPGAASTLALGLAFAVALGLALLAPVYVGPLLALWSRLVPASAIPAWWLARASALQRLTTTSASVAPLTIAMIVLGTYFSASLTWELATDSRQQAAVNAQQGLVLFAPGAAIAILGSAVVLFAIGGNRARERAQYRTVGATTLVLAAAALIEAAMYVVTATIVSVIAILGIVQLFVAGLAAANIAASIHLDWTALGACILVGFIAIGATTVLPVFSGTRDGDAAALVRDA